MAAAKCKHVFRAGLLQDSRIRARITTASDLQATFAQLTAEM